MAVLSRLVPRLAPPEFLDFPNLPASLRRGETDVLHRMERLTRIHEAVVDEIVGLLPLAAAPRIIDLGSGSGGPVLGLVPALRARGHAVEGVLTDLHPVPAPVPDGLRWWPEPVDATAVPVELRGVRTSFLTFHHLPPAAARAMLADAARAAAPILVFETTTRSMRFALANLFGTPLLAAALHPRAGPLVPLLVGWDATASALRSYTADEMLALAPPSPRWSWRVHEQRWWGLQVRWLVGAPRR